jgi:ABC-type branched-subunit amino acid transport system substrate-binding protein
VAKRWTVRLSACLTVVALVTTACGDDDDDDDTTGTTQQAQEATTTGAADTTAAEATTTAGGDGAETTTSSAGTEGGGDLEAIGLWDDGPCDESLDPLPIGLQTVFQSGVLTLEDQAQALEAAAVAFNARGGANGHCVEVTTCDDGADPNKAVECVRTLDDAGIVATVNDTTAVATEDVTAAYAAAGIPRFAISPNQADYGNDNNYPFDAGGTGTSVMMPQALLNEGVTKIAIVRVDVPSATALAGFYEAIYADDGVEIVADLAVPAGTTDYSQFILASQDAGAEALAMPIGGQEGIQVVRAGQQLDADLLYSSSLGSFPPSDIADLGDYAERMLLNAAIPPATFDDPVVDVLAEDLAASGVEALQRLNLKSSPMRSWVGLYALLYMLREAGTEEFTRDGIREVIEASGPIPMLGLTDDWTPVTDHEGVWKRAGNGYYGFYKWDPTASFGELEGNFVLASESNWDEVICGSPVGGPC